MKRRKSAGSRAPREALYAAIAGLQRLTELMERRRLQLARGAGLSPQQWRVLEEISHEEFMPSLFARASDSSPAAVSRTLRQLLDKRLVVVSISPDDARKREYALTARGRQVLERIRADREAAIDAIWEGFGASELERFTRFGEVLASRLESFADATRAESGEPR